MNTSVFVPRRIGRLLVSDARNVGRDPTLFSVLLLSGLPGLAFARWHAAWDIAAEEAFHIIGLSRLLAPVFLVLPSFLLGWIAGFLLLEDRDEGPLLALEVTPIGTGGFFAYRVALTSLLTAIVTLLSLACVAPGLVLSKQLLVLALLACQSVISAFVLLAIARNKVEGLAVTKVTNLLTLAPILAAIDSPWRYVGAVVPTFWIGEALGLNASPLNDVPLAVLALMTHATWALLLYRAAVYGTGRA